MNVQYAFAVLDQSGSIQMVTTSGEQAVQVARSISPYVQIESGPEVQTAGAFGAIATERMPSFALKASGLPRVNAQEVMALTSAQAHRRLHKFFPGTKYETPGGMAAQLLGQNYKTAKKTPEQPSYVVGLSLLPYDLVYRFTRNKLPISSGLGLCVGSSPGCRASCLVYSGQAFMDAGVKIKAARTEALTLDPVAFCRILVDACSKHLHESRAAGLRPFIRLNVFSDVPWELVFPELFAMFPRIGFYDYTKVPGRATPSNYDLSFSWSGTAANQQYSARELARGRRIVVVFMLPGNRFQRRNSNLPVEFMDMRVIDGDSSDVRPYDPAPSVIGLRWKLPLGLGKGQQAPQSFVVPVQKIGDALVATQSAKSEPISDPDIQGVA